MGTIGPTGYAELLEQVKAHAYDLALRTGRLVSAEEAAGDWYDTVYLPCVASARRVDLQGRHAHKTDTDVFFWVYGTLRQLRVTNPSAGFDDAAEVARTQGVTRAERQAFRREAVPPLRPRPEVTASESPPDRMD